MTQSFVTSFHLCYPLTLGVGLFFALKLLITGVLKKTFKLGTLLFLMLITTFLVPIWNYFVINVIKQIHLLLPEIINNSYWLAGPLIYLIAQRVLLKRLNLLIPILIGFGPLLLYSLYQYSYGINSVLAYKASLCIWGVLTSLYVCFVIYSAYALLEFRRRFFSNDLTPAERTTLVLILGFIGDLSVDIFLTIKILFDMNVSDLVIRIFEFIRALYVLLFAILISGRHASTSTFTKIVIQQDENTQEKSTADSSRQLRINESSALAIAESLKEKIHIDRLFLLPDLNLKQLTITAGVSIHELSEVLNVHLKSSFYTYINNFRVEHSLPQLKESENAIIDIALASGFNSKSSFYSAFRKHYKTTPAQYQKQHRLVP
ncbi:MAG: AraC-like DNA-binding protein [Flavobacteriales bacterium]|jgi:AraC-like DNA-binding protein